MTTWHRDFRQLWIGEAVSRFGSSVSTVALPLIAVSVLQATTFEVGLLSAAAWLPWLLIGLPVGAWVDRWSRRPIRQLASAVSLFLFTSIPLAAHADRLTIELLLTIAVLTGAAAVFLQTAYTAYLPNLLAPEDQAEGNAKLHGSASAAQIAGDVWLRTLTVFGGVSDLALMGYQSIIVVFLVREVGVSPGLVGA